MANAEKNNPEDIKEKIGNLLKGMEKSDKIKCAKYFKEHLGDADYRKSDDKDALLEALEVVKSL